MTYDELWQLVLDSGKDAWEFRDDSDGGTFLYRNDLDVRIERRLAHEEGLPVYVDWASGLPDPSTHRWKYEVFFRNTAAFEYHLLEVDGGRAQLPFPRDRSKKTVSNDDYRLALAVDRIGSLDEYMKRIGMKKE